MTKAIPAEEGLHFSAIGLACLELLDHDGLIGLTVRDDELRDCAFDGARRVENAWLCPEDEEAKD